MSTRGSFARDASREGLACELGEGRDCARRGRTVHELGGELAPDDTAPRGFTFPIDTQTGLPNEDVLARRNARSPHGLVRAPSFLSRVKKDLSGRIMVIVGRNDEFELFAPASSFARELTSLGVETLFVETEQDHGGYLEERYEPALRFVLERLESAK